MPSHSHSVELYVETGDSESLQWNGSHFAYDVWDNNKNLHGHSQNKRLFGETRLDGGSQPHTNMPPYLTVNMWVRKE